MPMKRVAFRVDELDDEILAKEPLYCQIRRAVKYQRAIEQRKSEAQSALRAKAAGAGLGDFTPGALPRKNVSPKSEAHSTTAPVRPALEGEASVSESPSCARSELMLDVPPSPTIENGIPACILGTTEDGKPERHAFISSDSSSSDSENADTTLTATCSASSQAHNKEGCLGKIYTRCCKLREHSPAPVYLEQLKGKFSINAFRLDSESLENSTQPPSYQQMQVLADLFAFVPVNTFIISSIAMNGDMFHGLAVSLAQSRDLKSLSLQGTKLDVPAWKYLCYLVSISSSLEHLEVRGMSRKNSEWMLLARAIAARELPLAVDLEQTDIPENEKLHIKIACEGPSSSAVASDSE